MTQQIINPSSTAPNDGLGDSPYNGMVKVNANFTELYTRMAAAEGSLVTKAPLASPTFTGTVGGITASMVGLSNVNNTSDANKPTSTAQQASIDAGDILRLEVSDIYNDFVASGLATPIPTNSLIGVMAPGIAYIQGKRTVQLISNSALTFTYAATRDTYNDMDSAGNITHVAVTNGAAEPAVTANCLRIEKVITDGTKITTVQQKAPKLAAKTVPIYFQLDGNGNIIANFVPRTGTVNGTPGTNLQDITNAGNGEPAVATDADEVVIFKGSPSVAKRYPRYPRIARVGIFFPTQTVATAGTILGYPAWGTPNINTYAKGLKAANYSQTNTTVTVTWPNHGYATGAKSFAVGNDSNVSIGTGIPLVVSATVVNSSTITFTDSTDVGATPVVGTISIGTGEMLIPNSNANLPTIRSLDADGIVKIDAATSGTYFRISSVSSGGTASGSQSAGHSATTSALLASQKDSSQTMLRGVIPLQSLDETYYVNVITDITGGVTVVGTGNSFIEYRLDF